MRRQGLVLLSAGGLALGLLLGGCEDDDFGTERPAGDMAGVDETAVTDGGMADQSTSADATADATSPDLAADASGDAQVDAAADAVADAVADAATDSGPTDGSGDSGPG